MSNTVNVENIEDLVFIQKLKSIIPLSLFEFPDNLKYCYNRSCDNDCGNFKIELKNGNITFICSECKSKALKMISDLFNGISIYSNKKDKNITSPQPSPQQGTNRILDLVVSDLQQRAEDGRAKYGTYLQANNGRDALIDLYQELLDACMYIRQLIEEGDNDNHNPINN